MKRCRICGAEVGDREKTCPQCGGLLEEKGKNNLLFLIPILVLGLILVGIGGFLFYYNSDSQVYARDLKQGDKYASILRYEDAVLSYEAAISVLPKKDEGYLRLAEVYYMQGDMMNAQAALRRGQESSGSIRISSLLDEYTQIARKGFVNGGDAGSGNGTVSYGANTEFDQQMLAVFSGYTYADYRRAYGEPEWQQLADGSLKGSWKNGTFSLYYFNTEENPDVIYAAQGLPHTYCRPNIIETEDIGILFTDFEGAISLQRLTELCEEAPELVWDEAEGRHYVHFSAGGCVLELETDGNGNIISNDIWNEIRPEEYEETFGSDKATVSGFVIDASTGKGIYGALLQFKKDGQVAVSQYSLGDGSYNAELDPGKYEVEISCGNYITEIYELEVKEMENQHNVNFILSSVLQEGSIRIVLEWGARPYDLDSHTSGRLSNGNAFTINFMNPTYSSGGVTFAELDVDDINGFGPETTTIYDAGAEFSFWIEDFRLEGMQDFRKVTVKVYLPGAGAATVFTGRVMDFGISRWNVFRYQDGRITAVDTYE